jgi:hypothetical protein
MAGERCFVSISLLTAFHQIHVMNTIVPKTFFLCVIAFAGMKAGNSTPLHNNAKYQSLCKQPDYCVEQISFVKQGRPDSTAEEKLLKMLADELNSIGIEISKVDLDAISDALTRGGQGAMALASMISTQIAKLKISPTYNGSPPATKTNATLPDVHIDDLVKNCKKNKNAKLALTQIIVPKLILLQEKNKKDKKKGNTSFDTPPYKNAPAN